MRLLVWRLIGVALITVMMGLSGCSEPVGNIPPGYIGKILTPTGWKAGFLEAGQVELGNLDRNNKGNHLVICEASSFTIKESFAKPSAQDPEDHRVLTKSMVPIAVDIYVQVMVPSEEKQRDSIFAQVTPKPDGAANSRVSRITLQQIYDQFARMTIRGKVRQIFSGYKDYAKVMAQYDDVNKQVAGMVATTFKETRVPLLLVASQLSNVKVDELVWAAENRKAAAVAEVEAINKVGAALDKNRGYLEKYKWDVLKELGGKDVTIVVNDGDSSNRIGLNLPRQSRREPASR